MAKHIKLFDNEGQYINSDLPFPSVSAIQSEDDSLEVRYDRENFVIDMETFPAPEEGSFEESFYMMTGRLTYYGIPIDANSDYTIDYDDTYNVANPISVKLDGVEICEPGEEKSVGLDIEYISTGNASELKTCNLTPESHIFDAGEEGVKYNCPKDSTGYYLSFYPLVSGYWDGRTSEDYFKEEIEEFGDEIIIEEEGYTLRDIFNDFRTLLNNSISRYLLKDNSVFFDFNVAEQLSNGKFPIGASDTNFFEIGSESELNLRQWLGLEQVSETEWVLKGNGSFKVPENSSLIQEGDGINKILTGDNDYFGFPIKDFIFAQWGNWFGMRPNDYDEFINVKIGIRLMFVNMDDLQKTMDLDKYLEANTCHYTSRKRVPEYIQFEADSPKTFHIEQTFSRRPEAKEIRIINAPIMNITFRGDRENSEYNFKLSESIYDGWEGCWWYPFQIGIEGLQALKTINAREVNGLFPLRLEYSNVEKIILPQYPNEIDCGYQKGAGLYLWDDFWNLGGIISGNIKEINRSWDIYQYNFEGDYDTIIKAFCTGYTEHWSNSDLYINGKLVTELNIPEGVEEIKPMAFAGIAFDVINLPSTIKKVGFSAFEGCYATVNVHPDSAFPLDVDAFYGCNFGTGFEEVDGIMYMGRTCAYYTGSNQYITLREGTEVIQPEAFAYSNVSQVNIPDSVWYIGDSAFNQCQQLNYVNFNSTSSLKYIGEAAFHQCYNLWSSFDFPASVEYLGESAFAWDDGIGYIKFPKDSKLHTIGYHAFYEARIGELYIPKSVVNYGELALEMCYGDTLTIAGNVPDFEPYNSAFAYKCRFNNIVFAEGVTRIGGNSFFSLQYPVSITLPSTLQEIGTNAFYDCFEHVVINYSNLNIKQNSESHGCVGQYAFRIISDVKVIGDFKFMKGDGEWEEEIPMTDGEGYFDDEWYYEVKTYKNTWALTEYTGDSLNVVLPDSVDGEDYIIGLFNCTNERFLNTWCGSFILTIPEKVIGILPHAFDFDFGPQIVINNSNLFKTILNPEGYYLGNSLYLGGIYNWILDWDGEKYFVFSSEEVITENNISYVSFTTTPRERYFFIFDYFGDESFVDFSTLINTENISEEAIYIWVAGDCFKDKQNLTAVKFPISEAERENRNKAYFIDAFTFQNCNNLTEIQLDNINDIIEVYNEEYDSWTNLIYIGSDYLMERIEDLTVHFKVGDRIYYFDEIMEMSSNYSLRSTSASAYALADIEEDNGWEIVGEEVTIGDFRFIGDTLVEYLGSDSHVVLPDGLNGGTYRLGARLFKNNLNITSITIPKSVREIGPDAFMGCRNLEAVYVPVKRYYSSIEFYNCYSDPLTYAPKLIANGEEITVLNHTKPIVDEWKSELNESNTTAEIEFTVTVPEGGGFLDYDQFIIQGGYDDALEIYVDGELYGGCNCYGSSWYGDWFDLEEGTYTVRVVHSMAENSEGVSDAYVKCLYVETNNSNWDEIYSTETTIDGIVYRLGPDYAEVCGWNDDLPEHAKILSTIVDLGDELPVNYIDSYAFEICSKLLTIELPNSLETLGHGAFSSCSNLTEVIIPEDSLLTRIEGSVFHSCYSLISISIPERVTYIGYNVFYDCGNLISITIPDSVTSIAEQAFDHCGSLTTVNISENSQLTWIGGYAFNYCQNLEEIYIPKGVDYISTYCFCESGLKRVYLPNTLESIDNSAFRNCDNLEEIVWYKTGNSPRFKNIGSYSLYGCTSLKHFEVPESGRTVSFGSYALYNCYSLEKVVLPVITSLNTYSYTFQYCTGELVIKGNISTAVSSSGSYNAFYGNNFSKVIFKEGVTSISSYTCYQWSSLKTVEIPSSLTSIGSYAFRYCYGLSTIINNGTYFSFSKGSSSYGYIAYYATEIIKNEPEVIGDFVFIGDTLVNYTGSDSEVILPENHNGESYKLYETFRGNDSIASVTIPESVTEIGAYTFYNCTLLNKIVYSGTPNIEFIGSYAFYNCGYSTDPIEQLEIPSITALYMSSSNSGYVFSGCRIDTLYLNCNTFDASGSGYSPFYGTSIQKLVVGEGVTRIGSYYFYNIVALTEVTIPSTLTESGNAAFSYTNVNKVNISDLSAFCKISYGSSAGNPLSPIKSADLYLNGELVTELTIPEDVTCISPYAFYGCTSINMVILPKNLEDIQSNAFYYCSNIRLVINKSNLPIESGSTSYGYVGYYGTVINASGGEEVEFVGDFVFAGDELVAYLGNDSNVVLPTDRGPYSLGKDIFRNNTNIHSVILPDDLTGIGEGAFYGCTNLQSIDIPEGISIINQYTFCNCDSLVEVNIPDNVTTIDRGAFDSCSQLLYVNIGENSQLTIIGAYAFASTGIANIHIPATVESIGEEAFIYCHNLNTVYIDSIRSWFNIEFESIDSSPVAASAYFYGRAYVCVGGNQINSISIPSDIFEIKSHSLAGFVLESLIIEPRTEELYFSSECMNYSTAINSIYVNSLEEWFMMKYEDLYNIVYDTNSVLYINNSPLENLDLLANIDITEIPSYAFAGCSSLLTINIPDQIKVVGEGAFYDCYNATELDLNNVEEIWSEAFSGCESLTSINISEKVNYIGGYAFAYCGGELVLSFNDNIELSSEWSEEMYVNSLTVDMKVIPTGTFSYLDSLTDLTLTEKVEVIGAYAFAFCGDLESVVLPRNLKSLGDYCFKETSIVSLEIPESVSYVNWPTPVVGCDYFAELHITNLEKWCQRGEIGLGVLGIMESLTSMEDLLYDLYVNGELVTDLVVPEGVTHISSGSFAGCSSISSITLPDSLKKVHKYAFAFCGFESIDHDGDGTVDEMTTKLQSINFGNGLEEIEQFAFVADLYGNIKSLTFPDSLKYIGTGNFAGFTGLTELNLGNGVEHISSAAFNYCPSLTRIVIPDTVKKIGAGAFILCPHNYLEIGSGVEHIGLFAFGREFGTTAGKLSINCSHIPFGVFSLYGFKDLYFGDNVKTIESLAFLFNSSIPKGGHNVEDVGLGFSFGTEITAFTTEPIYLGKVLLNSGRGNLVIKEGTKSTSMFAFLINGPYLKSITFPESLERWNGLFLNLRPFLKAIGIGDMGDNMELLISSLIGGVEEGSGILNELLGLAATILSSLNMDSLVEVNFPENFFDKVEMNGWFDFSNTPAVFKNAPIGFEGHAYSGNVLLSVKDRNVNEWLPEDISYPGMSFGLYPETKGSQVKEGTEAVISTFWGHTPNEIVYPDSLKYVGPLCYPLFGAKFDTKQCNSITIGNGMKSTGFGAFLGLSKISEVCTNDLSSYCQVDWGKVPQPLVDLLESLGKRFRTDLEDNDELVELLKEYIDLTMGSIGGSDSSSLTGMLVNIAIIAVDVLSSVGHLGLEVLKGALPILLGSNPISAKINDFSSLSSIISRAASLYQIKEDGSKERIEHLVLPEGTPKIGDFAFATARKVRSLKLASDTKKIGDYAFTVCPEFWFGDLDLANVEEIGNGAFALSGNLNDLLQSYLDIIIDMLPDDLFGTDEDGDGYDDETGSPIPTDEEKLTYLLSGLMMILDSLGLMGSSVNEDGTYSMKKFDLNDVRNEDSIVSALSLRSGGPTITIPGTTKRIGKMAFMATPVGEVILEEGVEEIDDFAFACTAITRIVLPSTIKRIGKCAFIGCLGLKEIVLSEGMEKIDDYAFILTGVTSITIPNSIKEIGEYAFTATSLKSIDFGSGVEKIGKFAFGHCNSLTSIVLPENVKVLGDNSFDDCDNIATFDFGAVEEIGNRVLVNNDIMYVFHLPNTVKKIGSGNFLGKEIVITDADAWYNIGFTSGKFGINSVWLVDGTTDENGEEIWKRIE